MKHLNLELDNELDEIINQVDLYSEATPPNRVDSWSLWQQHPVLLIAAEYGSGKTYTIQQQNLPRSLYISHRTCLNDQNKPYFTQTTTPNSLPRYSHYDYDYVIIDELCSMLPSLEWEKINFTAVVSFLRQFKGKIIALDRDATKEVAKLFGKLISRHVEFYPHELTVKRNKFVTLTRSINDVYEIGSQKPGVRLILSDSAKKAKEQFDQILNEPSFLITAQHNANNNTNALETLRRAEACGDCWVFTSPAVQAGLSLDSEVYTFTAYVHCGNSCISAPVHSGMQGLHRVRGNEAAKVVCVLAKNKKINKKLSKDEILQIFRNTYVSELGERLYLGKISKVAYEAQMKDVNKSVGFEIHAHFRLLSEEQSENPMFHWRKELLKSGYDVKFSLSKKAYKYEAACEKPDEYELAITKEFAAEYIKASEEDKQKVVIEDSGIRIQLATETREQFTELSWNSRADIIKYLNQLAAERARIEQSYEVASMMSNKEYTISKHSLFAEFSMRRHRLFRNLFKELYSIKFYLIGSGMKMDIFASSSLTSRKTYQELKAVIAPNAKDTRWFYKMCSDKYGITFEKTTKKGIPYRRLKCERNELLTFKDLYEDIKKEVGKDRSELPKDIQEHLYSRMKQIG